MRYLRCALLIALSSVAQAANDFEIRQFRFAEHRTLGFERLVIEFRAANASATPDIISSTNNAGTEVNINLSQVNLTGGIPEAAINDTYTNKSRYLGPLTISTDDPNAGPQIKVFLKQSLLVDAFWMKGPDRLVLDVFQGGSMRAEGRHVALQSRAPRAHKRRGLASTSHASKGHEYLADDSVICFPSNAQVVPAVSFSLKNGSFDPNENVKWELANPEALAKSICFPRESQTVASLSFEKGSAQADHFGAVRAAPGFSRAPTDFSGGAANFGASGRPGLNPTRPMAGGMGFSAGGPRPAPGLASTAPNSFGSPAGPRGLASSPPAPMGFPGASAPSSPFPQTGAPAGPPGAQNRFQRSRPGGGRLNRGGPTNFLGAPLSN